MAKDTLTKKEKSYLVLISNGYNAKEIAKYLGLSHETTKCYSRNIRTKLEVNTIAGAVGRALREGVIE